LSIFQLLLTPENFTYAWAKVKRMYAHLDGYTDNAELSCFEIQLERNLHAIRSEFEQGAYQPDPLRMLPRPKKMEDGAKDRQYFHVSVRDQVAWMAIANALGPTLDKKMPAWSYGNRLYRAAWFDSPEGARSKLEVGPYRHASGYLYRKFQQSWPLFRRHIAMTAKNMVREFNPAELDQSEERAVASAKADGLPYLDEAFWPGRQRNRQLFHASIDLKEFFPNVSVGAILQGFEFGLDPQPDKKELIQLIGSMLKFSIRHDEMPTYLMKAVAPVFPVDTFTGIPTGLFVAGFLANAAMLPVDASIDKKINTNRRIAHFRFVDDHVILAYEFDQLCSWIEEYKDVLLAFGLDAKVNTEKTDPLQLAEWLRVRDQDGDFAQSRESAVAACVFNGANPTQLLTKTLAQVSAIATTNADVLDDDDIAEQLKLLEWLLLADLPEREIRPDTRAAFAAGQIAKLAPILLQEENGLVELMRQFAAFESSLSRPPTRAEKSERRDWLKRIALLEKKEKNSHNRHLRHCFSLLMQAFQTHPAKARLFHRLHDYCRLTGFAGVGGIAEWIGTIRRAYPNWANYYSGLSLQILATSIPRAVGTLISYSALRSDVSAALDYLTHISGLKQSAFHIASDEQAWFHRQAALEVSYAAYGAALVLKSYPQYRRLSEKVLMFSDRFGPVGTRVNNLASQGQRATYSSGIWAHLLESQYGRGRSPSNVWNSLLGQFDYSNSSDLTAVRRYPQDLPQDAWEAFLMPNSEIRENDSGWIREVIEFNPDRTRAAAAESRRAFSRAAKVNEMNADDWMTAKEWSQFTASNCGAFDPRRGEWTALEIIRQLVAPLLDLGKSIDDLDAVHPYNVVISKKWAEFGSGETGMDASWESWRTYSQVTGSVRMVNSADRIKDYRYHLPVVGGVLSPWYPHLRAVGQLLLGLLACDHSTPLLWNLRGNEAASSSGRGMLLRSLPISSFTTQILASCLGGRSAETRVIQSQPTLFGLAAGDAINDGRYDPPLLVHPQDLLKAVEISQRVLQRNQIAVSLNQPRQLIPFRLKDFPVMGDGAGEENHA
jgi:hypothetical protein